MGKENKLISIFIALVMIQTLNPAVIEVSTKAEFDKGEYNNTIYNQTVGAIILNLSNGTNGTYISEIFDMYGVSEWKSIEWRREFPHENLVLWLHMDENSSTARDYSSLENNGSGYNLTVAKGIKGNSLYFNGVNSHITIPDDPSLNLVREVSIFLWMNESSSQNSWARMVARENINPGNRQWVFKHDAAMNINALIDTDSGTVQLSMGDWRGKGWIHAGFTAKYNGSHTIMTGYLNGTKNVTTSGPGMAVSRNVNVTVGRVGHSIDLLFKGAMDEIMIFNKTLNESEVRGVYESTLTRLSLYVRSCNAYNCSNSSWVSFGEVATPKNFSLKGRYFQFMFKFESISGHNSPLLTNVKINLNAPPSIILNKPSNNTLLRNPITFNCTAHDEVSVSNITLLIWNSTSLIYNNTINTNGSPVEGLWTLNLTDGSYEWNCLAYDTDGYSRMNQSNNSFETDSTPPIIYFNPPTPSNSSHLSIDWVMVNATCIDKNKENVSLFWQGMEESFDNNQNNTYWKNKTNLSEGVYRFYVKCNDTVGNYNITEERIIVVDQTPPSVISNSPSNNTTINNNTVVLEYNVSDNLSGIVNCSLIIDNKTNKTDYNVSVNSSNNFTAFLTEGKHSWRVECYDEASNYGVSEIRELTISNKPPNITLLYPPNNTIIQSNSLSISCRGEDDYRLKNITLIIWKDGNVTFSSTVNVSNSSFTAVWNLSLTNGIYSWNCIAFDLANNKGESPYNYTFSISLKQGNNKEKFDVLMSSKCLGEVLIKVLKKGSSKGVEEARVYVNDNYIGKTNENGELVYVFIEENNLIEVSKAGYYRYNKVFLFDECGKREINLSEPNISEEEKTERDIGDEKLDCVCGYIKNGECIKYECCVDSDCKEGSCKDHLCVKDIYISKKTEISTEKEVGERLGEKSENTRSTHRRCELFGMDYGELLGICWYIWVSAVVLFIILVKIKRKLAF